jgi:hypothetical protein
MIDEKQRAVAVYKEDVLVVTTNDQRRFPAEIDVPILQGDSFALKVRWVDGQSDVPLSAYNGTAEFRSDYSGGSVIARFGTVDASLTLDLDTNVITLTAGTATTAGWSGWTRGVGDLKLITGSTVRTILEMRPILRQEVA